MTRTMTYLPDPVAEPQFYDSVAVKRALAWVVDVTLIALMTFVASLLTLGIGFFFLPVMFLAIGFTYRWFTIAGGSATWGMRLMAIELRDQWGKELDFGSAFLHTLGYTLSIGTALIQLGSMLLMLTTERGQGLTDMVLGTVMVNRRG
ncbi:RDD family protein [Litorisediminicola beolgyonensis]|uniref:RDD family protein n=1 Tax=Litorisediminicola beolgyonensis TaxID=1173614 RepID=A0ABW3ZGW0_9RHOB